MYVLRLEWLLRGLAVNFTVCLLTNFSSDVNTIQLSDGVYYLRDNVFLKVLVKILLSYVRGLG
jgi:hypothetical protein